MVVGNKAVALLSKNKNPGMPGFLFYGGKNTVAAFPLRKRAAFGGSHLGRIIC
jgi:hypothetical protein